MVSRHDELQHRRGLLALARPHPRRAQHRLGLVALALHRSELGLVELALRLIELNAPRDEQLTSFAFVLWSSAVACRPGSRMRTTLVAVPPIGGKVKERGSVLNLPAERMGL